MQCVRRYWNHNTYYHRALMRQLPPKPGSVLDIGCGDGVFATRLAERAREVLAIDTDPSQVAEAGRRTSCCEHVTVRRADFMAEPFQDESFDAVTSLAVLHHLPLDEAMAKMRRILRPGGCVLVLGVWTDNVTPMDKLVNIAATTLDRGYMLAWGDATMNAPTVLPATPLADVRQSARTLLPGAALRRRLLWRYTLSWTKPGVST